MAGSERRSRGVRLIKGNILMSKHVTSYVCINLSCFAHARTLAALEHRTRTDRRGTWPGKAGTITHRAGSSSFNERYSIIFKYNESLVNSINEPTNRCRGINYNVMRRVIVEDREAFDELID